MFEVGILKEYLILIFILLAFVHTTVNQGKTLINTFVFIENVDCFS